MLVIFELLKLKIKLVESHFPKFILPPVNVVVYKLINSMI